MERLFSVVSEEKKKEGVLLWEWGEHFCCSAWFDKNDNILHNLDYYSFQDLDPLSIESIIREVMPGNVKETIICSAFKEALLVPPRIFNINQSFPDLIYPDAGGRLFNDMIAEWQVINQYNVPLVIYNSISNEVPNVSCLHSFTCSLKVNNGMDAPIQLNVQFDTKQFRVLLKKEGKILLAQIYPYSVPLDVVYYLLKILQQHDLNQEDTHLIVSGLIEEDSALFKELYNYFLNMEIAKPGSISLENNNYPAHFFTSIYNLAACV
ncbi:MAG TPA: DUF3822 family protein [Chitinophagaceae bacterium]